MVDAPRTDLSADLSPIARRATGEALAKADDLTAILENIQQLSLKAINGNYGDRAAHYEIYKIAQATLATLAASPHELAPRADLSADLSPIARRATGEALAKAQGMTMAEARKAAMS